MNSGLPIFLMTMTLPAVATVEVALGCLAATRVGRSEAARPNQCDCSLIPELTYLIRKVSFARYTVHSRMSVKA